MGQGLLPTWFVDSAAELPSASKFNNDLSHLNMTPVNMVSNGRFYYWNAGTSVAPDLWTLTGSGAAIARSSTAYRQTYAAQITYGTADSYLTQSAVTYTHMKGKDVRAWAWVKSSTPNQARIKVVDGVGTYASTYHTGGGGWELLTVSATISNSATSVTLQLHCEASGAAIFDSAMMVDDYDVMGFYPSVRDVSGPAGSDTQVMFNDSGILAGISTLIFTKATGLLQSTIVKATSYFQGARGGQVDIDEGDTTPSVAGVHFLRYNSTNNITITNLDNGVVGQDVFIGVYNSGTLTISNSFAYVPAGGSPVLDNHDIAHLINMNGLWHVVSVSHNS